MERIQKEPQITKRFYLTGGTALSEFYLRHRISHDIDLFVKAKDVDESSMVIIPFDRKDMEEFFLKLAKSLESEIFQ